MPRADPWVGLGKWGARWQGDQTLASEEPRVQTCLCVIMGKRHHHLSSVKMVTGQRLRHISC